MVSGSAAGAEAASEPSSSSSSPDPSLALAATASTALHPILGGASKRTQDGESQSSHLRPALPDLELIRAAADDGDDKESAITNSHPRLPSARSRCLQHPQLLTLDTARASQCSTDPNDSLTAVSTLGASTLSSASTAPVSIFSPTSASTTSPASSLPGASWDSTPILSSSSGPASTRAARRGLGLRRKSPSLDDSISQCTASTAGKHQPDDAPTQVDMLAVHPQTAAAAAGSDAQKKDQASSPAHKLNDALNGLAKTRSLPTTTAMVAPLLSSMQSPCFYHQRFDDAVDINKILEEIMSDGSMSHSRLVQTATGVREVSKQLQRRPIRRAVRNVMIVTKARDNQLVYLTRELATWLLRTPRYGSDRGVNVYVDAKLRNSKRFDAPGLLAEDPQCRQMLRYWTPDLCWAEPEKFDLVLTLGGDGTVLFTSWLFQRVVPPVLSFSLGSLGFMTTFEFAKYKEHLDRVMGDDGMKINLRMRFSCTVWRSGGGPHSEAEQLEQFEVLNELVIDRGPSPYVSNLELYGDDELLTVVQADGCIFSTPTGSTAYSLSAGGSLVHPDIPAILLTPICPHTLSFRPMVLSDTMALRVAVPRTSRATAHCSFDGKGRVELRQGDYVTITASQYPFPTVTRTDTEWFDCVSRTLRWNVRSAAQKPFGARAAGSSAGLPFDGNGGGEANGDDGVGGAGAEWDIDTDSACYASEEGSVSASPIRRQMSMLGL